jgi:hypothetical protein
MDQWWERNKGLLDGDIVRGGYTKDKIEDFTGCIPLLLESCFVNEEMNLRVDAIRSIWNEVATFTVGVKATENRLHWET